MCKTIFLHQRQNLLAPFAFARILPDGKAARLNSGYELRRLNPVEYVLQDVKAGFIQRCPVARTFVSGQAYENRRNQ